MKILKSVAIKPPTILILLLYVLVHTVPAPLPLIGTAITPAKLTYREFFMAMAFLGSARSKNNKTQVCCYNNIIL